jgi:hypothetical protein
MFADAIEEGSQYRLLRNPCPSFPNVVLETPATAVLCHLPDQVNREIPGPADADHLAFEEISVQHIDAMGNGEFVKVFVGVWQNRVRRVRFVRNYPKTALALFGRLG